MEDFECQVRLSGVYPVYHGGSTEGLSAGGWYNSGSIFGRFNLITGCKINCTKKSLVVWSSDKRLMQKPRAWTDKGMNRSPVPQSLCRTVLLAGQGQTLALFDSPSNVRGQQYVSTLPVHVEIPQLRHLILKGALLNGERYFKVNQTSITYWRYYITFLIHAFLSYAIWKSSYLALGVFEKIKYKCFKFVVWSLINVR